jgi:hypothetical protein
MTSDGTVYQQPPLVPRTSGTEFSYWPTPVAGDTRDRGNLSMPAIKRRMAKGKQMNLSMVVSDIRGALNPNWVEWLLGFGIGHTDLDV